MDNKIEGLIKNSSNSHEDYLKCAREFLKLKQQLEETENLIDQLVIEKQGQLFSWAGMHQKCKEHGWFSSHPRFNHNVSCPWCKAYSLSTIEEFNRKYREKDEENSC